MWASAPTTHWVDTVRIRIGPLLFVSACCNLSGQCHQLKTGAFVLCEKTAKQMQLVGAGLCSARQDTPNYRKSSANPYALTRVAVGADAGHSRSRRRSVTDVGLPLAGTHRPGRMHRFYGNLRRICNFSMGRQSRRPLQAALRTLCRGGRLCPPAGCTDFTGIFGEFIATPLHPKR